MESKTLDQWMADLAERLDQGLAENRRHIDGIAERLEAGQQRLETRQERLESRQERLESRQERLEDGLVETRRHFDVVAERLESNQQLLAEGLTALDNKLDRVEREIRRDMGEGFSEVKSMIRLSYSELDRRLHSLENTVFELRNRVEKLEAAA